VPSPQKHANNAANSKIVGMEGTTRVTSQHHRLKKDCPMWYSMR
jgi:hypothetical protein